MGDDGFLEFVRDQLRGLDGQLEFRRMFGGHGVYLDGFFFAILMRGRFYLKASDATRGQFVSRGMEPFRPNERQTIKSYYEAPPEVLESPAQLAEWVRRACAAKGEGPSRTKALRGKHGSAAQRRRGVGGEHG